MATLKEWLNTFLPGRRTSRSETVRTRAIEIFVKLEVSDLTTHAVAIGSKPGCLDI